MCHQPVRRRRGNLLTVTLNASEPVNPQQNPHSSEEALTRTDHIQLVIALFNLECSRINQVSA